MSSSIAHYSSLRSLSIASLLPLFLSAAFCLPAQTPAQIQGSASASAGATAGSPLGKLPRYFEPNRGQAAPEVLYLSHQGNNSFLMMADRATLVLAGEKRLNLRWAGGRAASRIAPLEPQPGITSYFRGRDPSRWQTGVPHFSRVRAEEVYPGVDLDFYGNGRDLEFDFIVKPGADPSRLRLEFDGQDRMRLEGEDVLLTAGGSTVRLRKPVVYQETSAGRREIAASFRVPREGAVEFAIARYDRSLPLVIDPVLVLATYLGGTGVDTVKAMVADTSDNIFLVGKTTSTSFSPMAMPSSTAGPRGSADLFVAKLNPGATSLLYLAIIGGSQDDEPDAAATRIAYSDLWVTGATMSNDFPTTAGSYRPTPYTTAPFAFVFKINAQGTGLTYSTYLGENGSGTGIAVNRHSVAHVAVNQGTSASVKYLSPDGASLIASSALYPNIVFQDLALDFDVPLFLDPPKASPVWVTGDDRGLGSLPPGTSGYNSPYQSASRGGVEAIAIRFSATGSVMDSTYIGGSGDDTGVSILGGEGGRAVIAGNTTSTNLFPSTGLMPQPNGPQQQHGGGVDGFIIKVRAYTVSGIYTWGTYFGGSGNETVKGFDGSLLVGATNSADFPLKAAFQPSFGGGPRDAFAALVQLFPGAISLLYSSYYGGSGDDEGVAGLRTVGVPGGLIAGNTNSTNLTVLNAMQSTPAGNQDIFLAGIEKPVAPFMCIGQNSGQPTMSRTGFTELTADPLLICTGGTYGTTSLAGLLVYPVTSRVMDPSTGGSEAMLTVDEPLPGSRVVQPAGQQVPGANVIQGIQIGTGVWFPHVEVAHPGDVTTRVFRVTNLRANTVCPGCIGQGQAYNHLYLEASGLPGPILTQDLFTELFTSPARMFVGPMQDMYASTVRAADHASAYAAPTIACAGRNTTLTPSTGADLSLRFDELDPAGFRNRHTGITPANADPALPPVASNQLGLPYQSMTGFYNPGFPAINRLNQAGLAQSGTRYVARFTNVPAGTRIWVTTSHSYAQANYYQGASPVTIRGFRTATDANGFGPYTAIPATVGPYSEVPITAGTGLAVWEVAGTDTTSYEKIGFDVVLSVPANSPAGGQIQVSIGLGPLADVSTPLTSDVPRYNAGDLVTFPIATVQACGGVRGDFDASGRPDLVWQSDSTRQAGLWLLGGPQGNQFQSFTWLASAGQAGWSIATVADLDGNNKPDVLWQNDTTRQVVAWYMGGAKGDQYQSYAWLQNSNNPGWTLVSAADLDGNGKPDLIWQEDATRKVAVWYMGGASGNQFQSFGWLQGADTPGWSVVGMADLDANGKLDLIWQNDTTRQVVAWYMGGSNGAQYQGFSWLQSSNTPGWKVIGITDLDGNGKPDLLWQEESTRKVAVWYMSGVQGNQFQSFAWVESNGIPGWRALAAR